MSEHITAPRVSQLAVMDLRYSYRFYPVGQGLFASGHLSKNDSIEFSWVFDCGTISGRNYLSREIDDLKQNIRGKKIDFFCLSHFDQDHVNGAKELLTRQPINLMVMPYYPLVERISIALATRSLSVEYLRFLLNPAEYMLNLDGSNLQLVILIAGGGSVSEGGVAPEDPPSPEETWDLGVPEADQNSVPAGEDIRSISGPRTRVVGHQRPFTVRGSWEFVFFNERDQSSIRPTFRNQVADVVDKYRQSDTSFEVESMLQTLRPLYAAEFGNNGPARNRISLVAYSGPLGGQVLEPGSSVCVVPVSFRNRNVTVWSLSWFYFPCYRRSAIAYFGDFPLDSQVKLNQVREHFGVCRWGRLRVIQVPHHGSSNSWYKGASAEVKDCVKVIASGMRSSRHPAPAVLADLEGQEVLLVNEMQGVECLGVITSLPSRRTPCPPTLL